LAAASVSAISAHVVTSAQRHPGYHQFTGAAQLDVRLRIDACHR
jgi:hypothetical protein